MFSLEGWRLLLCKVIHGGLRKKTNYYNFSIFVTKSLNPDTDPTNVSEYLLIKDMKD
jgi:hypothetical protein